MNEKEFDKEFPGLKGMGCGLVTTNRPNGIKKQDQTYQQLDIQEHCLDKQRVKEIIDKIDSDFKQGITERAKSGDIIINTLVGANLHITDKLKEVLGLE